MNACIRAVVRVGLEHGMEVLGIRRGYAGLLAGEIEPLERRSVVNVIQHGGTILGTSRSEEFRTPEGRAGAREVLAKHGIEGLVAIGGDGTFRGASALIREGGPPCIGVPGTIDNDVLGTDRSLGFDTAVNTALEAIDRIRDTAASHELLHFIGVMGRHCGWLALAAGLAGGVEAVLVPETPTDVAAIAARIEEELDRGKRFFIVVVAEGDETGGARAVAAEVERSVGRGSRVTTLGYIQRGGPPTAADRILAGRLGAAAVDGLAAGHVGRMVGEVEGKIVLTPLEETWAGRHELSADLLALSSRLA